MSAAGAEFRGMRVRSSPLRGENRLSPQLRGGGEQLSAVPCQPRPQPGARRPAQGETVTRTGPGVCQPPGDVHPLQLSRSFVSIMSQHCDSSTEISQRHPRR